MEQAHSSQIPAARTAKLKLIWGLICLIGPSALWIVVFAVYAISNALYYGSGGSSFGEASIAHTVTNVITYLFGVLAFLTWLPGIIVGIILLATRHKAPVA